MNSKKVRWNELLSKFNFKIEYIKRKENRVVDAINRRSQIMQIPAISNWKYDLKIRLHEALKIDDCYLQVVSLLQESNMPLKFAKYALVGDGTLQFNGRIYILDKCDLKKIISQETHNVPYGGHRSYQKTLTKVKK